MSFHVQSPVAARLFELLDKNERRILAETGAAVRLAANECLFETGDPGGTLYVVESGSIESSESVKGIYIISVKG